MSKTYAPRSRALAADIALQAAVDEAVGLLRGYVAMTRDLPGPALYARRVDVIYRTPADAFECAHRTLLAAAATAELILGSER